MSRRRKFLIIGAMLLLAGSGSGWLLLRPIKVLVSGNASAEVVDRNGQLLHAFLAPDSSWRFQRELSCISPHLINATIAAEDQRFWRHHGIDPAAILRAAWNNATGGTRSGASTLTMQAVKLSGHDSSSWSGKLQQALAAVRLDRARDKEDILEFYLNAAPYGANLIGAEAAARRYFNKPAAELSLAESALLAALPKAPSALYPLEHPERAKARRDYVLARMQAVGYITEAEAKEAKASPIKAQWHDFPRLAPHLAQRYRRLPHTQLTLDASLQELLETATRKHLLQFDNAITNAAVVVVRVPDRAVLAQLGGADFFGASPGAQVDLASTPRSPGSALKPFLYALAMEQQKLYPTERLLDDDFDLGAYAPKNFDDSFNGLITATDALRYSLNVPAVLITQRAGVESVLRKLQQCGISTLREKPEHYGLGIAIGNCEVRLDEIAAAYAAIADEGRLRALNYCSAVVPAEAGIQVVSPGIAAATMHMLEQPLPREKAAEYLRTNAPARIAWKTGTSTGFHDAWAVVFNAHYVVAVWTGNSDGRASSRLVGVEAALPLAGRIFRQLSSLTSPGWPAATRQINTDVCATSGLPPSPHCPATENALLPRELYLHRKCAVHTLNEHGQVATQWPGSVKTWDLASAQEFAAPAPVQRALNILTPAEATEYVLTGDPSGDKVRVRASCGDSTPLHWYLGGNYLGASNEAAPLYITLTLGEHRLTCMTPEGAIDAVTFKVTKPHMNDKLAQN